MVIVGALIGGRVFNPPPSFPVHNPATGQVIGLAPSCSLGDLDEAVAAARKAFPLWSVTADESRAKICEAVADVIAKNSEELAKLLTLEQGKPLNGMGSRFELGGTVAWAKHTASLSLPIKVLQDDNQGRVELTRKPIGVVGSITPWNWPLMIAVWHLLPALRTGNTVVIKPSPHTPLSTLLMMQKIAEILPPGVVNCVTGPDEIGAAMSSHPGIDKIVFTGSTPTGRKIYGSAALTIKRLTLELGGNDAGIVMDNCDPKAIAPGLFWGAFLNNGQTCAALKRLYVHDKIHDAVCSELVNFARSVKMGDGFDETSELGPIQNRMQFDKVSHLIEDAKHQGGKVLMGGEPSPGAGNFYPITLISGLSNGVPLVDEEQFGPVLPIIRYEKVDEVVSAANDNPNGLGGSVWSRNIVEAKAVAHQLECGSAWINKHGAIQPNVPFGGVKQSGLGSEFAEEGLQEYTNIQVIYG